MAYYWVKLHLDILDNHRLMQLPAHIFKRYISFLLLAREHNREGLLDTVPNLAWRLCTTDKDILKALQILAELGIMAETPEGWLMVDFVSRQAAATTYERVRKARERKLASQEDETNRYINSYEDDKNEKTAVVKAVTFPSTSASAAASFSDSFDSISISDSISDSGSGSDPESDPDPISRSRPGSEGEPRRRKARSKPKHP